jgi:hypothetical protein
LLTHDNGAVTVVDVKPRLRQSNPKVASALAWSREVIDKLGWGFEVWGEPNPQLLANLRFLAAYRRTEFFRVEILAAIQAAASVPTSLREIEIALEPQWPLLIVRSHMLHLLWRGQVAGDLESPLDRSTIVRTQGQ